MLRSSWLMLVFLLLMACTTIDEPAELDEGRVADDVATNDGFRQEVIDRLSTDEGFRQALVDALANDPAAVDLLRGDKGDKGDKGDMGDMGEMGRPGADWPGEGIAPLVANRVEVVAQIPPGGCGENNTSGFVTLVNGRPVSLHNAESTPNAFVAELDPPTYVSEVGVFSMLNPPTVTSVCLEVISASVDGPDGAVTLLAEDRARVVFDPEQLDDEIMPHGGGVFPDEGTFRFFFGPTILSNRHHGPFEVAGPVTINGPSPRVILDSPSSAETWIVTVNSSGLTWSRLGSGDMELLLDNDGNLEVMGDIFSNGVLLTSDRRFKTDIVAIDDARRQVMALEGVSYELRGSSRRRLGLIAQDVESVVPEAVVRSDDGRYAIDYPTLIPLLIETIKQQDAEIVRLSARLQALEKVRIERPGSLPSARPQP